MCGIAGIVDFRGPAPAMSDVSRMLGRLAHRGPDDEGAIALGPLTFGMRRLSILDTSAAGHQPMRSRSGRTWLVHNGEIYNFLELAGELRGLGHVFDTATDTEVILTAYEQWGIDCVQRFNGIWAFALWDDATQELHLSRDRFGVKPLFLAEHNGTIGFASEIKALLTLPWVGRDPEPGAIREFLVDGLTDHTDRTFFRSIRRVAAATTVTIGADGSRERRYWAPAELATDASVKPAADDGRRVEELRSLLIDAVALQLRSDVPLGSCLSGGLDSSSIVTTASGIRSGTLAPSWSTDRHRDAAAQLAFFAEFDDPMINERAYADAVVAATGVKLVTTSPTEANLVESIEQVVRVQDEPFGSTSIVAQFFVMKAAQAAGVKVLLDGQGADEVLAGYPPFIAMRYAGALRIGDPRSRRVAARLIAAGHVRRLPALGYSILGIRPLPPVLRRNRMPLAVMGPALRDAALPPWQDVAPAGTILATNLWRQIASENLPELLRYEDRNSMAFGIEARVPFLDHRLVEAGLMLPDRLKISGRTQKVALRQAMAGIVPEVVLHRTDKVAFRTPQARWLRTTAPRLAGNGPAKIEREAMVRPGGLSAAIDGFLAGRLGDDHLWRLLSVELWLRSVVRP